METDSRPNLKTIALPVEHGGWGFLFEPIILGLWVAPSVAGGWLCLAAVAVFLLRHPLKLALNGRHKGWRSLRTVWAERFVFIYGLTAATSFALALFSTYHPFWPPFIIITPLVLTQIYYDLRNRSRELIPEIVGAISLGVTAAVLAMAAGWPLTLALALWFILITRSTISIIYVRARVRLERGKSPAIAPVWAVHLFGLFVIIVMAYFNLVPRLTVLALLTLLIRAMVGLSSYRRPARPKTVGWQEMIYGFLTVALTAMGYSEYI